MSFCVIVMFIEYNSLRILPSFSRGQSILFVLINALIIITCSCNDTIVVFVLILTISYNVLCGCVYVRFLYVQLIFVAVVH
jgi:hypothetical protein